MDPKKQATRLLAMRQQLEQEKVSNDFNKAMETSPMVDVTEKLFKEYKAAKKPKAKPAAERPEPVKARPGSQPVAIPYDQTAGSFPGAYSGSAYERRLIAKAGRADAAPVVAQEEPKQTVSPEERIKGVTAAQAEMILSDIASARGRHGEYSPEETELIKALRERAKGFDYDKAKQQLSQPYVPSFMGGKK